jgi:trimethylamine:corrinoid methyltransferase-like protein
MENVKYIFNYDKINDTHKEAAQEIVDILKTCGAEMQAELISKKFKLVEPIRYKVTDSEILMALRSHGLPVTVQGFIKEGDVEYPIVNVIGDVRVWNEFLEKYESSSD